MLAGCPPALGPLVRLKLEAHGLALQRQGHTEGEVTAHQPPVLRASAQGMAAPGDENPTWEIIRLQ